MGQLYASCCCLRLEDSPGLVSFEQVCDWICNLDLSSISTSCAGTGMIYSHDHSETVLLQV